MAARATFTAQALRELRTVRHWIAAESGAERADRMVDHIVAVADLLAENPKLGRERPEISPGLRSFVVWPYVVCYRPLARGARIMRVIHGRQDLDRAFREPEQG
ncbi:type II toxin-antitoxin system RelE/ParE family toxin [Benzoatithermus flavus]|uniref:Type II toxin-antitoxin system RelE/ParE family toxin n=1 Tax=Benzoatithermus flavus TaxID=3108223 RepID=A0ABU8XWN7_9PROT